MGVNKAVQVDFLHITGKKVEERNDCEALEVMTLEFVPKYSHC